MSAPKQQYMKLIGGSSSSNSTIYNGGLIKIGDTIKISGTANNNGIFTVSSAVSTGGDVYFVLKGNTITNETSAGAGVTCKIEVIRATGDKMLAMANAGLEGQIAVWSDNNTTSPGSLNNGWTANAITPTLSGLPAKYIYFFVDEALRSCNINEECESTIKWFGFIQRDQFGNSDNNSLTAKFAEWQEHPNKLSPPRVTGKYTIAYGIAYNTANNFTANTVGNYYLNPSGTNIRGVRLPKRDSTSNLRLKDAHNATTTAFTFENSTPADVLDQASTGEVITIGDGSETLSSQLVASPTEYLFCKTPSTGSTITYDRAYGGALVNSSAPASHSDEDTPIIERGVGWNIAVMDGTSDGGWLPDTYEFYETFIYDGNQESLPVKMGNGAATIDKFNHTAAGGKSLRVAVYADIVYNGRISGGRIYIRPAESDDELTLLLDIDIVQGVRSSLLGEFNTWVYSSNGMGFEVIPDDIGNCREPNIDTYTTINGFSNQTKFISIGKKNEMYKDVVVANRRAFIVNVRTSGYTGEIEKYGDRLMYSEINRFDTFLEDNFIDVSKGDYGEYVAIKTFADRLLAYKHNLVHVINISNPNPANWYLEDTLRYGGINFKYSATNTKYGVAWVSDTGCYLYDGNKVTNLIEQKLGVNEVTNAESDAGTIFKWSDFVNGSAHLKDAMIGYDSMSNALIILRSPSNGTTNSDNAFIFDFNTGGWALHNSIITDSDPLSNFFQDWHNNLCVAFPSGDDVHWKKYLPVPLATSGQKLYTKDIDFGDPSTNKKVYAITLTYKSSVGQANALKYAVNGKQSFSSFATKTMGATTDYDVVTFKATSPISCGSIQFLLELPSSGTFELNEMSIEYRVVRNKTIPDG